MASTTTVPVTPDTLVTLKVSIDGANRKFKLPLKELGPNTLPAKLRFLLNIPINQTVTFERFSDSAGAYTVLDPQNLHTYKTLARAAKAKLKLRLRATFPSSSESGPSDSPAPSLPVVAAAPPAFPKFDFIEGVGDNKLPAGAPQSMSPPVIGFHPPAFMPALVSTASEETIAVDAAHESARIDEDAPVPDAFPAPESLPVNNDASQACELALRLKQAPPTTVWSVYCNACDAPISNAHVHCSICDDGDFDLCYTCVDQGVHCPGEGHWLIKRFIRDGAVINSTTETVAPKAKESSENEMPGAYTEEKKVETEVPALPSLTCNACTKVFPEADCVTCTTCEDFDLCVTCHLANKHGHHPGHAFEPVVDGSSIGELAEYLCAAGRNIRHAAICDGCDKSIRGVRHKCLDCPDWDYCSECIMSSSYIHPKHRFVPVYDRLAYRCLSYVRHIGIFCDGPLCKEKAQRTYIEGVRYKCAVCHDTDFCANCEASPSLSHERTHPLIKFKTPVKNVSITTIGEDHNGMSLPVMGDQPLRTSTATVTVPSMTSPNASTQAQTADVAPAEETTKKSLKEKIEIKDLLAEPIQEKSSYQDLPSPLRPAPTVQTHDEPAAQKDHSYGLPTPAPVVELAAHFVRDIVPDGTKMQSNTRFFQMWTLVNPGPLPWPAGCSVRYVGGDNTLNVDHRNPSTATEMAQATESNVMPRRVEVGEHVSFRILMKSPHREGRAISYWRLKTPDGVPFGHRLWCDIDVVPSPPRFPFAMPSWSYQTSSGPLAEESVRLTQYQESLMLLEQQNKERLRQARQEMDSKSSETKMPDAKMPEQEAVKQEAGGDDDHAKLLTKALLEVSAKGEEPAVESPQDKPVAETQASEAVKPESSVMIFPQLDKESTVASSSHDVPATAAESTKTSEEDNDLFEDAESLQLVEGDSDDDEPFHTDEEYDILDASDEEIA